MSSHKRTLDSFFKSPTSGSPSANKKPRLGGHARSAPIDVDDDDESDAPTASVTDQTFSRHAQYPFPIPELPISLSRSLRPTVEPKHITDKPDLDLVVYEPYLAKAVAKEYGAFLRDRLPFYRVRYTINRFGKEMEINTPRYTTVFGIDDTSRFSPDGTSILDRETGRPVKAGKYKCKPRPLPQCLNELRKSVELATSTRYNFALVNFYSSGSDSISYHSDDEHFLEPEPSIASFSFVGVRDFLMRHKTEGEMERGKGRKGVKEDPGADTDALVVHSSSKPHPDTHAQLDTAKSSPLKFTLHPGTMILMRGPTQRCWMHSIPKRANVDRRGRINVTFRKNMTPAGTENYYRYNVGTGVVHRWDPSRMEMVALPT